MINYTVGWFSVYQNQININNEAGDLHKHHSTSFRVCHHWLSFNKRQLSVSYGGGYCTPSPSASFLACLRQNCACISVDCAIYTAAGESQDGGVYLIAKTMVDVTHVTRRHQHILPLVNSSSVACTDAYGYCALFRWLCVSVLRHTAAVVATDAAGCRELRDKKWFVECVA